MKARIGFPASGFQESALTLVLLLLLPAGALAICSNPTAQKNFLCDIQQDVFTALPCGVTHNEDGRCYRINTAEFGCTLAIGDWNTENFIAVWWERKPNPSGPKPAPSDGECQSLELSIPLCSLPEQPDPGCPNPAVSGDCSFPCGGFRRAEDDYGWDEKCHAYALMPRGWRQDPWLAAVAFFAVGKAFPSEALSWRAGNQPYGAVQALAEGRLGETVLGAVGETPLWGDKDGLIDPRAWRRLVREVGVCFNQPGALLASPHWELPGRVRFPAPVNCDGASFAREGLELWTDSTKWPAEKWAASGVRAADVLPRLKRVRGFELVCVTPKLADQRRQERAAESE